MQIVVLVTGAAKGIGLEIVKHFLAEGAFVALNDRTPDKVAAGMERLLPEYPDQVIGYPADVRCARQVQDMVAHIFQVWGRIDVLVNNAGIYPSSLFLEMSTEAWDEVMDVNAKGTFLVSQAVARQMVASNLPGHIINIASGSYQVARVGAVHYCASKAAVVMMTKVMAMELAQYGIRVNAVAPGLVQVEDMDLNPGYIEATVKQIPAGRAGHPKDIAEVVFQLAQVRTDYLTGAVIAVDGGLALGRYGLPRS